MNIIRTLELDQRGQLRYVDEDYKGKLGTRKHLEIEYTQGNKEHRQCLEIGHLS